MSEAFRLGGSRSWQAGIGFLLVLASWSGSAQALQWTLSPSLSVTEAWSDNLDLDPEGEEDSGFLTSVTPGVSLTGRGNRLEANLAYSLSAVFEHGDEDGDSTDLFHNLTAGGTGELVERTVFLEADARASQSVENLGGGSGSDLTAGNDNLTQNYGVRVGPRLENRLGRFALSTLRYAHERVWFVDEDGDERAHRGDWSLQSGPMFQRTRWSAQASYQDVASTDGADASLAGADGTLAEASFTLRQLVTPQFEVNATGGYEKNDLGNDAADDDLSGEQEGTFWDVGIRWRPNRRLDLEVGGGERFFGRSLRARLDYRLTRVALNVSYQETLADNRSIVLGEQALVPVFAPDCPAGVEGCTPVGQRLVFRTNTVDGFFISRQLRSSVSLNLKSHAFVLSGFRRVEEFQGGGNEERQLGGSVDWVWSLTESTQLSSGGRYAREEFGEDRQQDQLWLAELALSQQVADALSLRASYRRQWQNSSEASAEYTENAVLLTAALRY